MGVVTFVRGKDLGTVDKLHELPDSMQVILCTLSGRPFTFRYFDAQTGTELMAVLWSRDQPPEATAGTAESSRAK